MDIKQFFNPNNIKDYIQGNFRYLKFELGRDLETHEIEQALWRAYQCQHCLVAGKCHGCGCKTPAMFFSPNKTDHDEKWDKMLEKKEWEEFKEAEGIHVPTAEILSEVIEFKTFTPKSFIFQGKDVFHLMSLNFLLRIDDALQEYGGQFRIVHTYLNEEYNTLKGEKNKMHTLGRAMDIQVFSSIDAAKFLKAMLNNNLSVGLIGNHFHIDDRQMQIFYQQ